MNRNFNILIVEDEVITAFLLESQLHERGYNTVGHAVSGEAALELFEHSEVDAVLMDISLAGRMDGIKTAEKILSVKRVPIVFITGYQDRETREQAAALSPAAYFIKPVDIVRLTATLDDVAKQMKNEAPRR